MQLLSVVLVGKTPQTTYTMKEKQILYVLESTQEAKQEINLKMKNPRLGSWFYRHILQVDLNPKACCMGFRKVGQ